jgi:hypothetical protein
MSTQQLPATPRIYNVHISYVTDQNNTQLSYKLIDAVRLDAPMGVCSFVIPKVDTHMHWEKVREHIFKNQELGQYIVLRTERFSTSGVPQLAMIFYTHFQSV